MKAPKNSDYILMARYLARMRRKKSLTQKQAAELMGKSPAFISRVETGKRKLGLVEFYRYCGKLGVCPVKNFMRIITEVSVFSDDI